MVIQKIRQFSIPVHCIINYSLQLFLFTPLPLQGIDLIDMLIFINHLVEVHIYCWHIRCNRQSMFMLITNGHHNCDNNSSSDGISYSSLSYPCPSLVHPKLHLHGHPNPFQYHRSHFCLTRCRLRSTSSSSKNV